MRRVLKWVGIVLAVIGYGGIPDDLANWSEWFQALEGDSVRTGLLVVGLLFLVSPPALDWWRRRKAAQTYLRINLAGESVHILEPKPVDTLMWSSENRDIYLLDTRITNQEERPVSLGYVLEIPLSEKAPFPGGGVVQLEGSRRHLPLPEEKLGFPIDIEPGKTAFGTMVFLLDEVRWVQLGQGEWAKWEELKLTIVDYVSEKQREILLKDVYSSHIPFQFKPKARR